MSHLRESELTELRDEFERQLAKLEKSMTVTDEATVRRRGGLRSLVRPPRPR